MTESRAGKLFLRSRSFQAGWGVIDQGFSSLTNFVITAAAAHAGSRQEFGAFSVALAVYILALWVTRSLVNEPFVVRLTTSPPDDQRRDGRDAVGAAIVLGLITGAIMLVAGLSSGISWTPVIVVMGLGMPALIAQDSYRYLLLAAGRGRSAAANDGIWLGFQLIAIPTVLILEWGVVWLTVAFVTGATIAVIGGSLQTGLRPRLGSSRRWIKKFGDLAFPFLVEFLTINGMPALAMLGLGAIGGVTAVGELRLAMLLLSPASVLCSGIFIFGLPEAVRLRRKSVSEVSRFVLKLALTTSAITLGSMAIISAVPTRLGVALLGDNWSPGRRLLLPVGALVVANACTLAGAVGLRALEATRDSLRYRMWAAPLSLLLGLAGALMNGAYGVGVGLAVGGWGSVILTTRSLRRAVRSSQLDRPPFDLVPPDPAGYAMEVDV